MTKKAVLNVEELRKIAERARKRQDASNKRKQRTEDKKWEQKAQKWADWHIATLPERIEKEARAGRNSLRIDLPDDRRLTDRAAGALSRWCWDNSLSPSRKSVKYSDDDSGSPLLEISWEK